jgi:endo-1,4-beta-xylanase
MKKLAILFLFFCGLTAFSQKENLINYNRLNSLNTNSKFGTINKINNETFEVVTSEQPKFIFNCAAPIPLNKKPITSGRVFLFSFTAKTTQSSLETGEAKVNVLFKQSKSYKTNIVSTQSISSNWKKYYIPFESNVNIAKNDLNLVLHFGFKPQTFLIKDIKFELFEKGTKLEALPRTKIKYEGMEPDAQWRKDALARIEAIRKGNIKLQLLKNGVPLANKELKIKLVRHQFPFGAAINAKDVVANNEKYNYFKKAFDLAVFENDLKIKSLQRENKKNQMLDAVSILKNDKITIKGHVLIWPGFNYLTNEYRANEKNPKKITTLITDHVNNLLEITKGNISHWDVVNEAYTNTDLQRITGSEEILYDGFRALKRIQPEAKGFTNEYGIISKGGLDTKKQEWYYNFVKRIDKNTNGLINGIGIQSHIGSDLTPPEKVLELLGYYATLGKQISISEFTMDIQEPKIREQYTRDFMIAAFSHPNVSEFLFWGYQIDDRKKVDIFNKDFSLGSMGKAYFSLVHKAWKTDITKKTTKDGFINTRGFYGTYEYTFTENNEVKKGIFQLKPRQRGIVKINIDE